MASFSHTGNTWRSQLYVGGVRESATFQTKFEAEAWAKKRGTELKALRDAVIASNRLKQNAKTFMVASELHSEQDIVNTSFSAAPTSGIYFLIQKDQIVYVGQSTNVHVRVTEHAREKLFDRINVIECAAKDLNKLEMLYIKKFNPILNIIGCERYTATDLARDAICQPL